MVGTLVDTIEQVRAMCRVNELIERSRFAFSLDATKAQRVELYELLAEDRRD